MTNKVTFLHAQPETLDLSKVLAATNAYTQVWQQGTFKFLPVLQESLERHMKLFLNCRQNMAHNALRVVAQLRSEPLRDLLEILQQEGDDPEILGIAQDTLDGILRKLREQVAHLACEQRALSSLPFYDATSGKTHLTGGLVAQRESQRQVALLLEHEQQKLTALEQSLTTLEANGIETRFEGVVPSLEQLSALAAPGGEVVVTAQAVSKAVEELKTLLGDLVEGMRYSQLQKERRSRRNRVRDLRKQLDEVSGAIKQGQNNLESLDALPELLERRNEWTSGLERVRVVLESFAGQFEQQRIQDREHVRQLDASLRELLAYEYELLNQERVRG
ncbi:alpha-xenorhabdolysin family binary toxin subunit B [Pseudomonas capeferrum]|uniref:alpha-xenorhabdolysin family binary toxin subunit B n=1 Tax=Pseudomonas capeferrum TaxID=1495066 RepID=UPI0015E2F963|nr:alpha-xenorhabdolysin family binary toxin subunit B [Pseudomonas capeferrum]MBA1203412.1 alpha-xenorhabdolysin family binary toxin subunit B [Pseudomonas capeferrum]